MVAYDELLDDIEEYLRTKIIYVRKYSKEGLRIPVRRLDDTKELVYANERDIDNPNRYIIHRLEIMPEMEE